MFVSCLVKHDDFFAKWMYDVDELWLRVSKGGKINQEKSWRIN